MSVGIVGSVVGLGRWLGLPVEEPIVLRSTNDVVAWLCPSMVVARSQVDHAWRLTS
jgi:hypothetical protein